MTSPIQNNQAINNPRPVGASAPQSAGNRIGLTGADLKGIIAQAARILLQSGLGDGIQIRPLPATAAQTSQPSQPIVPTEINIHPKMPSNALPKASIAQLGTTFEILFALLGSKGKQLVAQAAKEQRLVGAQGAA